MQEILNNEALSILWGYDALWLSRALSQIINITLQKVTCFFFTTSVFLSFVTANKGINQSRGEHVQLLILHNESSNTSWHTIMLHVQVICV